MGFRVYSTCEAPPLQTKPIHPLPPLGAFQAHRCLDTGTGSLQRCTISAEGCHDSLQDIVRRPHFPHVACSTCIRGWRMLEAFGAAGLAAETVPDVQVGLAGRKLNYAVQQAPSICTHAGRQVFIATTPCAPQPCCGVGSEVRPANAQPEAFEGKMSVNTSRAGSSQQQRKEVQDKTGSFLSSRHAASAHCLQILLHIDRPPASRMENSCVRKANDYRSCDSESGT